MGVYSIAEAKDKFSTLVKQAEEGEDVAITRHGKVVAYLRSAQKRAHRRPSHELVAKIVERAKTRPSLRGSETAIGIEGHWHVSLFDRPSEGSSLELIDEALAGEEVTITRHGTPVVELRPARSVGAGRPSPELIDRIAARAKTLPSLGEDAVDIIRRMRDDYP